MSPAPLVATASGVSAILGMGFAIGLFVGLLFGFIFGAKGATTRSDDHVGSES